MPQGDDPPIPFLPEGVFDALTAMTYASADKAFDLGGGKYWPFIEEGSAADKCQWNYGKASEIGINISTLVPQATYDVIDGGTWNDGVVAYNSKNYKFRGQRNTATGDAEIIAVVVA